MGLPIHIDPVFPSQVPAAPSSPPTAPVGTLLVTNSPSSQWGWLVDLSVPQWKPSRAKTYTLALTMGGEWVPFTPPIISSTWMSPLSHPVAIRHEFPWSCGIPIQGSIYVPVVAVVTPGTQNVTACDMLRIIANRLLEDYVTATPQPVSSMWSIDDWFQAIDQSQQDFIRDSGVVVTHYGYEGDTDTSLGITPNVEYRALPDDTIDVLRVGWISLDNSGAYSAIDELPRDDAWSLDAMDSNWEIDLGSPKPTGYNESLPRTPSLYFVHPPSDAGRVDLLTVAVPAALNSCDVRITVPDEFSVYVIWGAISILLSKQGEAHDPQRAEYAASRYQEGLMLAKMLLDKPFIAATEV